MKMTMHIDDKLLDRVMKATGASSKTHAIDIALREIDRRAGLAKLASEGLGLSADELKEAFDPASTEPTEPIPQIPVNYVGRPRSRR